MPRLVFAPHALDDLDRLTDFLLEQSPELGAATAPLIVSGLEALKDGWRVIQFPQLIPPYPGLEFSTSFQKYEFIFEKLEDV